MKAVSELRKLFIYGLFVFGPEKGFRGSGELALLKVQERNAQPRSKTEKEWHSPRKGLQDNE